jgi:hypothetical protein
MIGGEKKEGDDGGLHALKGRGVCRGRRGGGEGPGSTSQVALGDALKQGREGEADWWGLAAQYRSAGPNLSQNGLNNLNSKLKPVQTLTHPKRIFP